MRRIEIFAGKRGGFYWRVRSRNGKITEDGGERYSRRWNAKRAATKSHPNLKVVQL